MERELNPELLTSWANYLAPRLSSLHPSPSTTLNQVIKHTAQYLELSIFLALVCGTGFGWGVSITTPGQQQATILQSLAIRCVDTNKTALSYGVGVLYSSVS